MNTEDRVSVLEKESQQSRQVIERHQRAIELLSGKLEATQSALLAIVASHPDPKSLAPVMALYSQYLEANAVASHRTDRYLQAIQAFHNPVQKALEEALAAEDKRSHGP